MNEKKFMQFSSEEFKKYKTTFFIILLLSFALFFFGLLFSVVIYIHKDYFLLSTLILLLIIEFVLVYSFYKKNFDKFKFPKENSIFESFMLIVGAIFGTLFSTIFFEELQKALYATNVWLYFFYLILLFLAAFILVIWFKILYLCAQIIKT